MLCARADSRSTTRGNGRSPRSTFQFLLRTVSGVTVPPYGSPFSVHPTAPFRISVIFMSRTGTVRIRGQRFGAADSAMGETEQFPAEPVTPRLFQPAEVAAAL